MRAACLRATLARVARGEGVRRPCTVLDEEWRQRLFYVLRAHAPATVGASVGVSRMTLRRAVAGARVAVTTAARLHEAVELWEEQVATRVGRGRRRPVRSYHQGYLTGYQAPR